MQSYILVVVRISLFTGILAMILLWSWQIHFFGTNRDIVIDNFFTSHLLAVDLLRNSLTLLGTIRKHRKEIPAMLRENREAHASKFLYDHENKITIVSYAPRRNRQVLLRSSSHGRGIISSDDPANRPEMILDYNVGKGGVDQLDENLGEFSCLRKTVRWPLLVFFNMVDVSCNNSFLHMKRDGYLKSKKVFMRNLSIQLVENFAKSRHEINRSFSRSITAAAELFGFLPDRPTLVRNNQRSTGRCLTCSIVSRARCDSCRNFICPRHKVKTSSCLCLHCSH